MTDAHCHVPCGDPAVREFLIGRDFLGCHPWYAEGGGAPADAAAIATDALRARLEADPALGVGEIGLDRLKTRTVTDAQRTVFREQLDLACAFGRPVVLHGAKCWGEVIAAVRHAQDAGRGPRTFLCHGFSRSEGLVPEIIARGGYISIGPSVLNDHAVNYRAMAKRLPEARLLVETDRTVASDPVRIGDVLAKLAALRGVAADALERLTDVNAGAFREGRV